MDHCHESALMPLVLTLLCAKRFVLYSLISDLRSGVEQDKPRTTNSNIGYGG